MSMIVLDTPDGQKALVRSDAILAVVPGDVEGGVKDIVCLHLASGVGIWIADSRENMRLLHLTLAHV